jgi:hypothetical protein
MKVKFTKDYSYTIKKNPNCVPPMVGCAFEDIIYNWKKDNIQQSVGAGGYFSDDKKTFNLGQGNWSVPIPIEYIEVLNENDTPATITNTGVTPQTFLQKHKNHLLIVGTLFLGYFAYKKFNK